MEAISGSRGLWGVCVEVYDWNQGPGLRIILLNIGNLLFHDKLMR